MPVARIGTNCIEGLAIGTHVQPTMAQLYSEYTVGSGLRIKGVPHSCQVPFSRPSGSTLFAPISWPRCLCTGLTLALPPRGTRLLSHTRALALPVTHTRSAIVFFQPATPHAMTAYHPHLQLHEYPYASYNSQRDAYITSTLSLFDDRTTAQGDGHTIIDFPSSVTNSYPLTQTLYPSSIVQTPSPSISITQPPEMHISSRNEPHVDLDEHSLSLNLLQEFIELDLLPGTYTPIDPSETSMTSSPMIHTHDQNLRSASYLAPQVPLEPSQPAPQLSSAPVPVGTITSPNASPARAPSTLRPDRVSARRLQRELRTCIACKSAKAGCRWPDANSRSCARCARARRECVMAVTKPKNQTLTIKDITHQIRDLEVRIQQQLDIIVGPEGRDSSDRISILESGEGRKCSCPIPVSATQAAEGSSAPALIVIHRAGCPASDPMGLYGRSRLMELQDPDSDAKDDLEEYTSITSEEEDSKFITANGSISSNMPMPAYGTPAATFFELARSLGSPQAEALPSPTGSNISAEVGLAGADYFSPNPASLPFIRKIVIERERLPSYLLNGTVKPAECLELFARLWNVSVSVLDPGLHTSARAVLWRCPFLFTVVIAIAARDYKPEQYPILMQEAKTMAGLALTTWSKSIEIVQAFVLLATFPPPSRRWDEDRTWLYLGYATRMAGDLQLNRPADRPFPSEMAEREHLNRIRTCQSWNSVSAAAKLGKQTSMQEDPVILVHKCQIAQTDVNLAFSSNILIMMIPHAGIVRMSNTIPFSSTAHYFRLVIYSICHGRSRDADKRMILALSEHHANSIYFKYSAEGWFTFGAFAAAFIVKVLCPTFAPVIDQAYRQHLRSVVMELINAYESKQVSIDERHSPSIYARFLTRLLVRADELNGTTPAVLAPLASSASPQIKVDSEEMERLFGIPSLHNLG
ncbi:fungal specific transcription factor domain-containing protein [Rhizoctonia solani AG-1 IA]|uniref:Fungal specific transcription factor domain-containing protein n=1 Tax=Thanatephorus cucumeris (strain AG1-IA) TaxID=983506 RepID=L8WJ46_THACA|nr:fungal specific transcription factor domain-containing protein [Rhizoctonia solani AG-1 IA]